MLDSKFALVSGFNDTLLPWGWDTKIPSNVNDADLFPGSTEPLQPREGPTEMIFCILLYEIGKFISQNRLPDFEEVVLLGQGPEPGTAPVRFLDLVKPFVPFLPEVQQPETKIPFNQKLMWTALTLLIFLIMSQMPLYGIVSSDNSDPLYWLRMVMASNRGTLMELGITPIISSGMVFQLLAGTHMIDVNLDLKSDR
ncbi:hypothetical protein BN1723_017204, partial [Verticillium longisporum]